LASARSARWRWYPTTSSAQTIVALNNSRPQNPTAAEIAAIIIDKMHMSSPEVPAHRAEWDQVLAAYGGVVDRRDDSEEGIATMCAASKRVHDCSKGIVSTPVRGLCDLMLLAEALHWELWSDPLGITASDRLPRRSRNHN
jgi:hypothetical protein